MFSLGNWILYVDDYLYLMLFWTFVLHVTPQLRILTFGNLKEIHSNCGTRLPDYSLSRLNFLYILTRRLLLAPPIIQTFGWEPVFYIFGFLGILWWVKNWRKDSELCLSFPTLIWFTSLVFFSLWALKICYSQFFHGPRLWFHVTRGTSCKIINECRHPTLSCLYGCSRALIKG